jgi:hypothetical protein
MLTGGPNGRCAANRAMVGMKCGRGCQQILSKPASVDKLCDQSGQCVIPEIPQNFEMCVGKDPCTSMFCDQDTQAHTARCVAIGCAVTQCCCGDSTNATCVTTQSCSGPGKACLE